MNVTINKEGLDALAKLPEHLQDGLREYVEQRIPTGGFLAAVLSNDLRSAVERADREARQALPDLVLWLHWHVPSACWGSREKMEAWLK